MKRRVLLQTASTLALLASGLPVGAQSVFPDKPVRVVVPFAAGNTLDTALRQVAEVFKQNTGQPLVVEARPGDFQPLSLPTSHSSPSQYEEKKSFNFTRFSIK